MPTLPSSIALTSPADGSLLVAADTRSDNTATQTSVNGIITALSGGTAGQVLTATSPTAVQWVTGVTELDSNQITANVLINTTTEGTAGTVITGHSVVYDGTKVKLEFSYPSLDTNVSNVTTITFVFLRDAVVVGQATVRISNGANVAIETGARTITAYDTPSAAAHTYAVKAFVNANSANVNAGLGGSGALLPAVLRMTKA